MDGVAVASTTRSHSGVDQPDWYKDAVIYQLHIKSFADSNDDGVGDFPGLIAKLDYIVELGVTAIWLLPFYPSPRLDDGYDISGYRGVHPDYGKLADVKRFVSAAHAKGLRVITELVINHTSDQHPWFQRARRAKPGSAHRDFYVWSDTDQRYPGTRIIFIDTERSNWTWDPVAGAYFWHRFYSHQPDLNFDNPAVFEAVLGVMRFWLNMGIDGLRLDAVPYLVEREGTNNENLPETHDVLKRLRAAMDREFPGRMLLAEANQWPEDTKDYFGDGDECHMAFHFPLMPRMYMAIAREDRFPITDILRQTPPIPASCQWAIFLRNHDELTLEMVTDSERDYLWQVYATDRRARLNLGIRRRLAPLLERDRRRVELMNFLLLSMPGTPVIYYGDELGMGDNIHLGDRDGVRTPMQWSPDRNGGFSRADPAVLVLPAIMDALYGFQAINVEAQSRDPHSLLNWSRRMLAIRRQHRAFGRGSLSFLYPKNRKVIAYLREHEGETVLCVANLSRSPQAVELDLSSFARRVPIELHGGSLFPPIGQLTYLLTLPSYGFYWFLLAEEADRPAWHTPAPEPMPEYETIILRGDFAETLGRHASLSSTVLPPYLAKRRWYAAKDAAIDAVKLLHVSPLPAPDGDLALAEFEVQSASGTSCWQLPLGAFWEDEEAGALPTQLALARVRRNRRVGLLTDAFALPRFAQAMVEHLRAETTLTSDRSSISFLAEEGASEALAVEALPSVRFLSVEQSNSSLIIDEKLMLKVFRRIRGGEHPEAEMSRHLTRIGFARIPALLGEVVRRGGDGERHSLAIVQAFVRNQGDAWSWTLDQLNRALDDIGAVTASSNADAGTATGTEESADFDEIALRIGQRLGELHKALAQPSDDAAFAPRPAASEDMAAWEHRALEQFDRALAALGRATLDASGREAASALVNSRPSVEAMVRRWCRTAKGTLLTRIHGDFHLGQVLVSSGDVFLIDFEGEPGRNIEERRSKDSPLRDVAGLLRSLDYVIGAMQQQTLAPALTTDEQRHALLLRFREDAKQRFLASYRSARGGSCVGEDQLLRLFLLEKAAYEIAYEAANRPAWLRIPLAGMTDLLAGELQVANG